jgi:type IX secretion system PorP/SprF family membrane protein
MIHCFLRSLQFAILFLIALQLHAQDPHFSQFYSSPMTLNPALAGGFDGKYRAGFLYRDQWKKSMGNPYSTSSIMFDLRLNPPWKGSRGDRFGVAANFYHDRVAEIGFSADQLSFTGAYHKSLNFHNTQYLSAGMQFSFNQRTINYNGLNFPDEFNGLDGYNFTSTEIFPENNLTYPDLAVGLNYAINFDRVYAMYFGGSVSHILGTNVSFYNDPDIPRNILHRRYTAHGAASFIVSERTTILPRAMYMRQGTLQQVNAGSALRYVINHNDGTSLYIGTWGRGAAFDENAFGLDAVIGLVGIEISKVLVGFSYDVNVGSALRSTPRNAFELSIIYLGEYENETILCPQF